jgi:soluble cytochrome b562
MASDMTKSTAADRAVIAIGAATSRKLLPTIDTLDIEPPSTDDGKIDLFNAAEQMTNRVEIEGRWLCGHALNGCQLSSPKIAEEVFKRYGRRTSVRNIDYARALYRAIPEYDDIRIVSRAGITWTTMRDALTLSHEKRLPQLLAGIRSGAVHAENADDAVAELKSIVDGGTHGEPLAVDASTSTQAAAADPGEAEYEAEATAAAMTRELEKLHDRVEGLIDRVYSKLAEQACDVPKGQRTKLEEKAEEMRQEAKDTADELDKLVEAVDKALAGKKRAGKKAAKAAASEDEAEEV